MRAGRGFELVAEQDFAVVLYAVDQMRTGRQDCVAHMAEDGQLRCVAVAAAVLFLVVALFGQVDEWSLALAYAHTGAHAGMLVYPARHGRARTGLDRQFDRTLMDGRGGDGIARGVRRAVDIDAEIHPLSRLKPEARIGNG